MRDGNNEKVLLDLNFPPFQDDLLALEAPDIKKILKTLKKLKSLAWNEVFQDKGLHWEEVKTVTGKYTIRLSQSYRAVVTRDGNGIRFLALHKDHDGAYGKK